MANNCCVTPVPPSTLTGTTIETPMLKGEISFDTAASKTVTETVITTTTTNETVREKLVDVLTPTILKQEIVQREIADAALETALSEKVLAAVEARVIKNQDLINAIVQKITLDKEFVKGIADKVVDLLLNDDDTLHALKQCIIASINRCDGTPLAVGDSVATCDEVTAATTAIKADVRRALAK